MNNLNTITIENLINVNGGGVTAKQTLGMLTGVAAFIAFGPVAGIAIGVTIYISDAIDDDNN